MVGGRCHFCFAALLLAIALVGTWLTLAVCQVVSPLPAAVPSTSTRSPLAGGSPLQPPGSWYGSDTMSIHSGMFSDLMPAIPNLEFGYTFCFGRQVNQGRAWGDYVLPINVGPGTVFSGETHGEYATFGKRPALTPPQRPGYTTNVFAHEDRIDLSTGGGYRTIVKNTVMLGANAFYDTSRLYNRWYSSGGFGLEMAANLFSNAAFDVNFNWYGNLFNRGSFINAWRNGRGSFDVEAGYSQGILENRLDLRLKTVGYSFDVGDRIWGWRVGCDLTTRNGMFAVKYEYGEDRLNDSYHSVTARVNVGFQLENLLSGQSPITMPAPVFVNQRNLSRLLGLKVKRNWHQPSAVLAFNRVAQPGPSADRVVAPFPLVFLGGTTYSAIHPFTPYPVDSLTPTGVINVTVTLADPAPAGLFISVAVIGDNNTTSNQGFVVATGGETTLTIPLTTVQPQSLFIGAGTDPSQIVITVVGAFSESGIESASIQFNQ